MIKALAGIAPRHPTIEKHKAPAGKINGKNGKVIYKSNEALANRGSEQHRHYWKILKLQNKNADSPLKDIPLNANAGTAGDIAANRREDVRKRAKVPKQSNQRVEKNAQKQSESAPPRSLGAQAKRKALKTFEDFAPHPHMRETLLASIPNVQDARTPSKTLPSSSDN